MSLPQWIQKIASKHQIYHSSLYTCKKSKFLAFAKPSMAKQPAATADNPMELLDALKAERKISKASHCMWVSRSVVDGLEILHSDADGETGADRVMESIVSSREFVGVLVVLRWFGGVKIGKDRFQCIGQCAKDVIDEIEKDLL